MTSSIECLNFLRSLQLLNLLIKIGVQNLILCPGSRSAPLAIAAGELNKLGLVNIFNSIIKKIPKHLHKLWHHLLNAKIFLEVYNF